MPLTHEGRIGEEEQLTEAQQRARKVHRPYAEGPLVRVAGGRNQAEAELIQGLLLEEGIPSMLRRTQGFDVPDMLAAGPRDVLVAQGGERAAREVLLQADLLGSQEEAIVLPGKLAAGLFGALLLVAAIVWAGSELGG